MAKESTFTFISETLLTRKSSDPEFRVSINSSGMLYFPREVVSVYDLKDKYFKFYADIQKKAIGWTYFENGQFDDMKKLKKLFIHPKNGAGLVSVKKLLSAIGLKQLNGSFSDLPVKKYKEQGLLNEEYHYVLINEKDIKDRRRKSN